MVHKIFILIILLNVVTLCSGKSDAEILVKFKESLEHADALSDWSASKPPCASDGKHWVGVLCANGSVFGLKLENMGLKGTINVDALSELTSLKTMSLMFNNFDGFLPNLKKLTSMKTIYLSNNKFSGQIPSNAFEEMSSLKKLHLANNKLSGQIPLSLATTTRLTELTLENNEFEGHIPNFTEPRWTLFNLSNNKLEGQIPSSLASMDKASFSGNKNLCGAPLQQCEAPADNSGLPVVTIVIIVIAVVIALAIIVVAIVIILQQRKRKPQHQETEVASLSDDHLDKMEQGLPEESVQETPERSHGDRSSRGNKSSDTSVKLTFLKDERVRFDMSDLLKASAEVLGSGVLGSTYKATMNDGATVVVKRYRKMNNMGKEDFHEHMRRLGRLNHQNLLPVVAFYYKKDEKLLITDLIRNGSLAVHLHGKKCGGGHSSLDWPTRLTIVKGIAKGLEYLYNELPSLVAPHGHLKSSNVLLNSSLQPILTDYGLIPILTPKHAQHNIIVYKSPEYIKTASLTNKSDVWSFGTLILEILTGKFPDPVDLTTWVESIVGEEHTTEIFDKDMTRTKGSEAEIIRLMKIGLRCCEADVDKRWDMKEVVEKIEEVKEKDMDDDFYSSYTSEGDMRSSRGLSDDFNFAEPRG